MNPGWVVIAAVLTGPGEVPDPAVEPALYALRQAAEAAGFKVVPPEEAARRVRKALATVAPKVDSAWLAESRAQLAAGREAFLRQDHEAAIESLSALVSEADLRLAGASHLDPGFIADHATASVALIRALRAAGQDAAAAGVLEKVTFRYAKLPLTEADVPRPLLIEIAEQQVRGLAELYRQAGIEHVR